MMHSVATMSSSDHHPPREPVHPWLRALEVFGVPFLCYAADERCIHVSPAASEFLGPEALTALRAQADRAVAAELRATSPRLLLGQFALARVLPAAGAALTLRVHVICPAVGDVRAVVVLHASPAARCRELMAAGLTSREHQVARLIAMGLATKEIAGRLGIASHTARHHTEHLFAKLGVRSRAAVAAAIGSREWDDRPTAGDVTLA